MCNHKILNQIFTDSLFIAFMSFRGGTFVIAINISVFLLSAVSHHHGLAISAEQLGREDVSFFCFVFGSRPLITLHSCNGTSENIFGNDSRNTTRNNNIAVMVFADIGAFPNHIVKAVLIKFLAPIVFQTTAVQIVYNACCCLATGVTSKNFKRNRCSCGINLIMLVLIDHITIRNSAAVVFAFERIFGHAASHFLCKVSRIIFSHAFQHRFKDNAFCPFGDCFGGGNDSHIVLFQHCLVLCRIITIAGEAIELPHDDNVESLFCTILDHALKFRAIVRLGRIGAVDVGGDNIYAVLFCKRCILPNLPFD